MDNINTTKQSNNQQTVYTYNVRGTYWNGRSPVLRITVKHFLFREDFMFAWIQENIETRK